MKRFLKTILLYAVIVAAITVSVNAVYMQKRSNEAKKFENVPYGIQIANFGSSHGRDGFNYSDTEYSVYFNFALSSQLPSYDLRILKHYIDHIENGGFIFLPISYFSFFGYSETDQDDFLSKNKRYYSFLPKELIKEYDPITKFFECYFPAIATDGVDLFTTLFYHTSEDNRDAEFVQTNASKHALSRYLSHVKNHLDIDGNRLYNQEEISAIYEIIQLCRERNIEPILVITPYLSEYPLTVRENDPDFFQDFYGVISEIQANTGVLYYDYSADERFSSRYDLFINTDHLNREGARQFTNILIEETLGK